MNTNKSEIALVLDRSGSMGYLQDQTISAVNAFLEEQIKTPGTVSFSIYTFNEEVTRVMQHIDPRNIRPLDHTSYRPDGCTALLDAVGLCIDELGAYLASLDENDRPGSVMVAIMTDGLENSSRKFTWSQIADKIKHQTNKYNWRFYFMGANQDAIATASKINISADRAATWQSDDAEEVGRSMRAQSHAMSNFRRCCMGYCADVAQESLESLLDKERGADGKKS